jgi:hypothetical protein
MRNAVARAVVPQVETKLNAKCESGSSYCIISSAGTKRGDPGVNLGSTWSKLGSTWGEAAPPYRGDAGEAHLGGGGGARGAPNDTPANRRPACGGGVGVHQAHDITPSHVADGTDVATLGDGLGVGPGTYCAQGAVYIK